jgi:two-component system, cell cycle sensor histidine kinase and response regulator CckA
VLATGSPQEALRLAEDCSGTIDLLMTDVIMPEMNGRDLAKSIMERYPGIRMVFMSGYTADVIARKGLLNREIHFIQKPFSLTDLGRMLSETRDSTVTSTR